MQARRGDLPRRPVKLYRNTTMAMKLAVIGGLGFMLSPAAKHLSGADSPARVVRCLDRGKSGNGREERRAGWKEHGARGVTNYDELLVDDDSRPVDGVIICAGKNGDDRVVLRELARRMSRQAVLGAESPPRFILHFSTVSVRFAQAAADFLAGHGIAYGNYPLTGGPGGAAAATMLILAGGDEGLYRRVEPMLQRLGKPRYFSANPGAGAEVKLIGHYLVFHGLLGICAGAAIQHAVQPEANDVEFFDFLNQGAGHTRQWELALRRGLAEGDWDTGFYCRHAAVDALYSIQLGIDSGLRMLSLLPMFEIALLFAVAVQTGKVGGAASECGTHAIYQYIMGARGQTPNRLLSEIIDFDDPRGSLQRLLPILPPKIRETVGLEIEGAGYFA